MRQPPSAYSTFFSRSYVISAALIILLCFSIISAFFISREWLHRATCGSEADVEAVRSSDHLASHVHCLTPFQYQPSNQSSSLVCADKNNRCSIPFKVPFADYYHCCPPGFTCRSFPTLAHLHRFHGILCLSDTGMKYEESQVLKCTLLLGLLDQTPRFPRLPPAFNQSVSSTLTYYPPVNYFFIEKLRDFWGVASFVCFTLLSLGVFLELMVFVLPSWSATQWKRYFDRLMVSLWHVLALLPPTYTFYSSRFETTRYIDALLSNQCLQEGADFLNFHAQVWHGILIAIPFLWLLMIFRLGVCIHSLREVYFEREEHRRNHVQLNRRYANSSVLVGIEEEPEEEQVEEEFDEEEWQEWKRVVSPHEDGPLFSQKK